MFIDNVKVKFLAGKGGNGIVAWRREKYLPKGGPYGGDGGKGGSITLEVDDHLISLEKFFNKQVIKAGNGKSGGTNNKQGKKGSDILIKVPVGTIVKDNKDNILFEFNKKEDEFLICKGGKGGRGNYTFRTPTNRAPNICTLGKIGEEKEILLELKLIADVGLIGMPNAGKSTLMKQLTKSKVKIAAYPFTTLFPNLGLIEFEDYSRSLMADIPGIIKGAHINKGLGLSFLKHIERTSILIFVIDITTQDPVSDFQILLDELKSYNENLLKRDFLTLINKMDLENENLENFKKHYPFSKDSLIEISALKNQGLDVFLKKLKPFCKNKF
ncbi:MAG: GTPase Obg [Candidatus Anoxychlamydiales bacterium]|nr:GTPase Obg [Candidatus Anoxychlamydiales bacterium]NGX36234.1 GTPase Obg [Candidatus Anoxychlamydiales bacterium]